MLQGPERLPLGCWGALLLLAAVAAVGVTWGAGYGVLLFLVLCLFGTTLKRLLEALPFQRERRLAEGEFARRWGLAPFETYEAQAAEALAGPGAPDTIILFQGRGLPHGGAYFLRVELSGSAGQYHCRRAPPRPHSSAKPPTGALPDGVGSYRESAKVDGAVRWCPLRLQGPLPDGLAARLLAGLDGITQEALAVRGEPVRDGFPCSVAVLQRGRPPLRAVLNYCSAPCEQRDAHVIGLLYELAVNADWRG